MAIKYLQLQGTRLSAFLNNSDTSFQVSGFLLNDGLTPVATTDIGDICYATIEPKSKREELISFTIDSVTTDGVATLTATRGLLQKSPYTAGGATFEHQNGSEFVISNNPGLLNHFTAKDNDEIITGNWTFNVAPTALGVTRASTSVLGNVKLNGSADTTLGVATITIATPGVVTLTAHTLIAGDSIKFTTTGTLPTGIVSGTEYYVIAAGLTANDFQLSATIGGAAINTTGAQSGVHTLIRTTPFATFLSKDKEDALAGGGDLGIPSATNKFLTEDLKAQTVSFTSSGTWTKDTGLVRVFVEVWAGGGSGGSETTYHAGGGGGGGYISGFIDASKLSATEAITVGAGGASVSGNNVGLPGAFSSFGSYLKAYGGGGGAKIQTGGGGGGGVFSAGASTSGDVGGAGGGPNGGAGGSGANGADAGLGGGGGGASNYVGGHSVQGGGGGNSGNSMFGGAGGGSSQAGAGGVSVAGGNGGAGGASATAGAVPGGGGGGNTTGAGSGAGGKGKVIVTEYYL